MKIAQIAPLFESVPPKLYGGTERIVSYLTEELGRSGHEVTLFASGDSITAAELVPCCDRAMRLHPTIRNSFPYQILTLEKVMQRAPEFDILHFHTDLMHFPLVRDFQQRTVTTLHGRMDEAELLPLYRAFPDLPLVSISNDQRSSMPEQNWAATVYNGLPRDLLPFAPSEPGDYLAFLGRIALDKRPDRAIEIAAQAGLPLKIAAKIDPYDRPYWDEVVVPLMNAHPDIEYVGELDERRKASFLGRARALLFPIEWREPFGLVMIEAMACGTPVIAWRRGAVPEVVEEGVSGFVVDTIDAAVDAARQAHTLSRAAVRRAFERRFTAERMAEDYLGVYRGLVGRAIEPQPTGTGQADASLRVVA